MTGSIGYATEQGLGIMAKSFYDHKIVDKFLIVPHSRHKNHFEWYPKSDVFPGDADKFLNGLTSLFLFETPFDWRVIPKARARGIKIILQPNECTQFPFPYEPDYVHCPTKLEVDKYRSRRCVFIPIPVDVKWRLRTRAKIFVHNAGHGGLHGRNGTAELLQAMPFVKSPIKLIVRTQTNDFASDDSRVVIEKGSIPYEDLFSIGDVFVFPDKFAGLSLPLQEAFASGMLIMTSNRFPHTDWLPNEPLIPIVSEQKLRVVQSVNSALIDPRDIAATIDAWYNEDISPFSMLGKKWGQENSWNNLKSEYLRLCAVDNFR